MPAIGTQPPVAYKYVLVHPRLDANPGVAHAMTFSSYDETVRSIAVLLPDAKHYQHAIFCQKKPTRDRAVADGWSDITQSFVSHTNSLRPKITTPAQLAVWQVLTSLWQTKSEIVAQSGISDSEWRTTIRIMEDRGLAKVNIAKTKRAKASNRAYRYSKGDRHSEALIQLE